MDIVHLPPRSSSPGLRRRQATIASLISRLMNHYWTTNDPPEIRRVQAEDWIADLIEFGPALVESACTEWRRTQARRPTIAEIRRLCVGIWREQQQHLLLAGPGDRDAYARSVGWASEDERLAAIMAARHG